jgi:2,4-diketo-3-deoxy-L-fuconate hydrolase
LKLIRFGELGREKPGVLLSDGTRVDVSASGVDFNEEFFGKGGLEILRSWMGNHVAKAPRLDPSVRWGAPICRPSKIVCVGLNYSDHVKETGQEAPKEPVIFFKSTSAIVGPYDSVMIPKGGNKLDWEVELAVIIGKEARYAAKESALNFVAGYVLHNDYSDRGFQLERGGQSVKGKSADSFAPLGPFVATREEIADPRHLDIWLKVNGIVRQTGNTGTMMFDVPTLVSYVNQFMTLLPGDVISTGSPAGVGMRMKPPSYLKAGDVVELGIEGLGESRQNVVAYRS